MNYLSKLKWPKGYCCSKGGHKTYIRATFSWDYPYQSCGYNESPRAGILYQIQIIDRPMLYGIIWYYDK